MAQSPSSPFDKQKVVAENRRARFDYFVEDRFEAGIALQGTEVKALRNGEGSIAESYATVEDEEVVLINSHIPEYKNGSWMNDEPLQILPTISVGGPGVNALAHTWVDELPFSLAVDEQYCIQMDPELAEPRASLWGMDNASTQIAVAVFIDRFLPRFLDHAAAYVPEPPDADDPDEADD